jgi:hypothetical protein
MRWSMPEKPTAVRMRRGGGKENSRKTGLTGDRLRGLLDEGAQAALQPAGGVDVNQVVSGRLVELLRRGPELCRRQFDVASFDSRANLADLSPQGASLRPVTYAGFFVLTKSFFGCGSIWHGWDRTLASGNQAGAVWLALGVTIRSSAVTEITVGKYAKPVADCPGLINVRDESIELSKLLPVLPKKGGGDAASRQAAHSPGLINRGILVSNADRPSRGSPAVGSARGRVGKGESASREGLLFFRTKLVQV